jgi:hypothetical protein
MAKFYGDVGYVDTVETAPGVWEEVITRLPYYGDITRNARRLENGGQLNDNVTASNTISVMADSYASQNFFAIRFVEWAGVLWKVTNIEVQRPRLVFQLGGVYNGTSN